MESLKAKLTAMREDLAAAEGREETAKMKTRDCKERSAKAENEAACLRRNRKLVEMNLGRTEDRTDEKLDRLESLNKHIFENETSRRKLERKEMKEDDTLQHLETRQKSRKIYAQEAEQRHREAFNKLRMLEAETAKVDARIRAAKTNERYFEDKLHDAGRTAGCLARSGESKQAKCDEYHEKCRRLSDKKDRVLITAECLERKAMQLENSLRSLRAETRETTKQSLDAKRELRDMLDEMNTYP